MLKPSASAAHPEEDVVVAEIRIAAPPERVFNALVDPLQVVQWWGQAGIYRCTEFPSDLRVGGVWRSKGLDGNGRQFEIVGEYLEVDPPRLISSTWRATWTGDAETRIRWELEPAKDGTLVRIRHSGFAAHPELAQAYRRFGSRVTVVEPGAQPMSREDLDVAAEIQRILTDEGIQFLSEAEARNVHGRSGDSVRVTVRTPSGEQDIEGSDILVAAGRIPNTQDIGLDEAGVALDARGYVRVNDRLETTAPGVWAMGDCAGSPQFTHVAGDDFRVVRDNLAGGKRSTRDRLVPYCMFTDPQLAHVVLSERDAQRAGIPVRVAKLPMSAVLRTEATDETQGFMKAIVARDDDRILGFTMIGAEAGEVMAAVQTAILAKLPYQALRDAVLAHPTMAEGLGTLFENIPLRSAPAELRQPLAATA